MLVVMVLENLELINMLCDVMIQLMFMWWHNIMVKSVMSFEFINSKYRSSNTSIKCFSFTAHASISARPGKPCMKVIFGIVFFHLVEKSLINVIEI